MLVNLILFHGDNSTKSRARVVELNKPVHSILLHGPHISGIANMVHARFVDPRFEIRKLTLATDLSS